MSRLECPRSALLPRRVRSALAALGLCLAAAGCGGETPADNGPDAPVSGAGASGGSGAVAGAGQAGQGVAGSPAAGASGAGSGGDMPPPAGMDAPPPDAGRPAEFDAGTDPARNQVQAGGICQRLAALQCAAEAYCCDSPGRTYEACVSAQLGACANELQLDMIAGDPITAFDAAKATAAFERFEELAAACDPDIAEWGASTDGLRSMLQGTVATEGTCLPPPGLPSIASYGAALASCSSIATHACLFREGGPPFPPATATCAARGDSGAGCFVDTNCVDALYCANPTDQYSGGTCSARKAPGEPCELGPECESRFCKAGACLERTQQAAYCLVL